MLRQPDTETSTKEASFGKEWTLSQFSKGYLYKFFALSHTYLQP
jgi:hypothetical protein